MDIKYHWDRLHQDWELEKGCFHIRHKHTGVRYDAERFDFDVRGGFRDLSAERASQLYDQARLAVAGCQETWRESLERALKDLGLIPLTHHKKMADAEYQIHEPSTPGLSLRCVDSKQFRFTCQEGYPSAKLVSKLLGLSERLKSMGWTEAPDKSQVHS